MLKEQPAELPSHFVDELKPGTKLLQGQYTIVRFLNAGGFGITYLARNSLDREVVIKECFPGSFCRRSHAKVCARSRSHENEFAQIVKLFVQEAKSLSRLIHPNIVGVHQVFEDNDTAYMAIDYIQGRDLLDIVEKTPGSLSPQQVVRMLKKLLGAVAFIHDNGMLHRDISPDNILVNAAGEPIMIDFGAARQQATKIGGKALSALRVVKDGYSPQEFYITGSRQGPASDLYALAATFYHVISGHAPTNAQARLVAIAENGKDAYVPLAGRFEGYPEGFLEAIDAAINVLPKDRLQSAREWLDRITPRPELNVVPLPGRSGPDAVVPKPAAAPAPAPREARRSGRGKRIALLLGSAAAATAAGYLALQVYAPLPADGEAGAAHIAQIEPAAAMPAAPEPEPEVVAPVLAAAGPLMLKAPASAPEPAATAPTPAAAAPAEAEPEAVATPEPEIAAAPAPFEPDVAPADAAAEAVVAVAPPAEAAPEVVQAAVAAPPETEAPPVVEDTRDPRLVAALEMTDPAVAPRQIAAAGWEMAMPFLTGNTDIGGSFPQITEVLTISGEAPSNDWAQEGVIVFAVNETFVSDQAAIAQVLAAMPGFGEGGVIEVPARIKATPSAPFQLVTLAVPTFFEVSLENGVSVAVESAGAGWRTRVSAVAAPEEGGLRAGDVLVSELTTEEALDSLHAFEAAIDQVARAQRPVAVFEITRNGEPGIATMSLATNG